MITEHPKLAHETIFSNTSPDWFYICLDTHFDQLAGSSHGVIPLEYFWRKTISDWLILWNNLLKSIMIGLRNGNFHRGLFFLTASDLFNILHDAFVQSAGRYHGVDLSTYNDKHHIIVEFYLHKERWPFFMVSKDTQVLYQTVDH